jgi:beta-glucosidase
MRSLQLLRSIAALPAVAAMTRTGCLLATISAAAVLSYSCSDDSNGTPGDSIGAAGAGGSAIAAAGTSSVVTAGAAGTITSTDTTADECSAAANLAKTQTLTANQPIIGVRSKTVLTQTVTFPSQISGSTKTCSVNLQFKDLNGNAALDPYEDWTKTAAERAADLLARMSADQKMSLLLHPSLTDIPSTSDASPSASLAALINSGVRYGRTSANTASVIPRAKWANNVQALCEATPLGIPFILSSEPAHSSGNGRVKAKGFSQWPNELGLAATGDLSVIENFGKVVAAEYRAIGISMALSPSADLFTDPRWYAGQFTFGEDSTTVGNMVAAYVKGLQGATLGATSVASVVGHYPGAGAAKGGWDGRLAKGKYLSYPGNNLDAHLAPFDKAIAAGAAGMMPAYGIPETGTWSGAAGVIAGATIEQVGASFNKALIADGLRGHSKFAGLVLAPWGVLDDATLAPPAAPWGVETLTKAQRLAKAVSAGVDQFGGLSDATPISEALGASLITQTQIDASASRALLLGFELGLFDNPYVADDKAGALVNTDTAYRAGLTAMDQGMVLLINNAKPAGWLVGGGDGTQTGDKGNAGNGSLKVLPAPPGEPYVRAGCNFYVMGSFDLDYVTSVAAGYGTLTNSASSINGIAVTTAAERMAMSDYVFIRLDSPFTADADSGALNLPDATLSYSSTQLADVTTARAAIDAWAGKTPASQTQIVVAIDAGRAPVTAELLKYNISALYIQWAGSMPLNQYADKVLLDVAFGIVNGVGKLPVGLPLSDAAMATQKEDLGKDGQDLLFVSGFGLSTAMFQ